MAPCQNHHTIKTFIEATKNGAKDELKTTRTCRYNNLSEKEEKALKELKLREGIFITNAEKGGATVILHVKDYIKKSERQLNDTEYYRHLHHDPTTENNSTVNKVIIRCKNEKFINM